MYRLLTALLAILMFVAACAQGVPVPADFPVKIDLPAGSEIVNVPGMDIAEMANAGMNMDVVSFNCSGGSAKVKKHITSALKSKGYEKMVVPGMADMGGNESFTKEGSNYVVSFSSAGSDNYLLMAMEMPDFSDFMP